MERKIKAGRGLAAARYPGQDNIRLAQIAQIDAIVVGQGVVQRLHAALVAAHVHDAVHAPGSVRGLFAQRFFQRLDEGAEEVENVLRGRANEVLGGRVGQRAEDHRRDAVLPLGGKNDLGRGLRGRLIGHKRQGLRDEFRVGELRHEGLAEHFDRDPGAV